MSTRRIAEGQEITKGAWTPIIQAVKKIYPSRTMPEICAVIGKNLNGISGRTIYNWSRGISPYYVAILEAAKKKFM